MTHFDKQAAISKITKLLGELADKSGGIFYNGWNSIKPAKLYVIGLNPGGDPAAEGTIIKHLEDMPDDYCAYTSEVWKGSNTAGKSPHQTRVKKIIEHFGQTLEETFITNAIFVRSRAAHEISNSYYYYWRQCWPVHQYFLSIIQPEIIICLGNGNGLSALNLLHSETKKQTDIKLIGSGFRQGKWFDDLYNIGLPDFLPVKVIGVPHPSRFVWQTAA